MDKLRQAGIILAISFMGELLKVWLPLPVPASIYGIVLMFLALVLKIIRVEHVRDVGYFLIEIMPLLFVPAGVGLMEAWGVLQPVLLPFIAITCISTVLVMGASGMAVQFVNRRFGTGRGGAE